LGKTLWPEVDGKNGKNGKNGKDGKDGKDGRRWAVWGWGRFHAGVHEPSGRGNAARVEKKPEPERDIESPPGEILEGFSL
jgi:hypothetical protein